MNQNTIGGSAKAVGDKVQQGVVRMTGDMKNQAEDAINKAAGAAQEFVGQAKEGAQDVAKAVQQSAADVEDYIRHAIEKSPYTTAFVALCAGFMIGRMGSNHD